MVQFQRYDGTTAELNPLWLIMNYRVRAISESDSYILIQEAHGLVASIAKGLFRSNHEDVPSGEFDLHPSLYRHYFSGSVQKRKAVLDAELLRALPDILADPSLQRLVIDTPEYYLIRPEWLRSSISFGGSCHATLGAMLQAWSESDALLLTDIEAIEYDVSLPDQVAAEPLVSGFTHTKPTRVVPELMILHVNGSPMSGSHFTRAWCTSTRQVYAISTSKGCSALPEGVARTYAKLLKVANSVNVVLERELLAMEKVLKEVGRMT